MARTSAAPTSVALTRERVLRDVDVVSRAGLGLHEFLDEAIGSLHRAVPHVAVCMATVDPSTLLLTSTLKFGDLRGKDDHDHEWGLLEYGGGEPTSFAELAHRAVPAVGTRVTDPMSVRLNDYMSTHYGYVDEMRLIFRDAGEVWGGLAVFRGPESEHFHPDEVEFAAQLSAFFARGVRAGLLSRYSEAPTLVASGPTVVIVDSANRIQQLSPGAEERLAELLGSETETSHTGVIASLVGAARRFAAGQVARPPRCRVRTLTGQWLVLNATPLTPRNGVGGDVVVTIDEARPPEIVPLVVAAFGLTPRERDVTQYVLQGMDTKEIAASMHLSSYTVQDHLKSIFTKADVRSRRELIARIYFDQYVPRMGTDVGPGGWFAASVPPAID